MAISGSLQFAVRPPADRRAACVRPFTSDDIPEVARLHRTVFRIEKIPDPAAYHEYFRSVFLDVGCDDGAIPSLVYQEADGRLSGFVGVAARHLSLGGRIYRAAVSSQFVVDPTSRVGLVALRLVKTFLDGPQDLSIADEATERSRAIWEGMGGTTALLLSIYWTRPLRPARLALDRIALRYKFPLAAAAAAPLAAGADALAAFVPGSYFRQLPSTLSATDLTPNALVTHSTTFRNPSILSVDYDYRTAQWLLKRAGTRTESRRLMTAVLRESRDVVGWYVCHLDRDGTADVTQLEATPTSISRVLDHLFYEAWRHGAVAVRGRLEPRYMQALSDKYCLFHRRGPWVLIKTSNAELLRAFEVGNTNFSRLDGEWSLGYHARPERRDPAA
jgi:hypothetical protein